jgi:hypothetical protein
VQSHNIRTNDAGTLMTCSSAEGAVIDASGWRLDVGGFTRGLWLDANVNYVGLSELVERQQRDLSDARIAVYDRDWRLLRTLVLHREGLVLDIRRLASIA